MNAGSAVCDAWLSLDYTVSNASVANLLLISFDRFMCVTRPLKYRVRRTHRCAVVMISVAWLISALLWTPWIVAWPFIDVRDVLVMIITRVNTHLVRTKNYVTRLEFCHWLSPYH